MQVTQENAMTHSASQTAVLPGRGRPAIGISIVTAIAAWFAVVLVLGANGAFLGAPGKPPLVVVGCAVVPLAAFAIALRALPAFREYVTTFDLRLIVGMQAWRYAGFGFLALYANQVLPGLFALPAGIGDIAIGLAAPWWAAALHRDPGAARTGAFRLWNVLGILDFVVAFATAAICAMTITTAGPPMITPMGQLPLVLIPAFMVPLFVLLHIAALMQSKAATR
jgi:hypothetical protein